MQISPLTIYAIQAIQAIRKAGPLTSDEIARRLDISLPYAKKATHMLQRAGLIKSVKRAGYAVVRRPSLLQVAQATEGILPDQAGDTPEMSRLRRRVRGLVRKALQVSAGKL